ncbi:MAG TPA: hypothetical protein DDW55_13440, partial [Gammaproteobacteria bacterium]|nr:hypothetical protein [Gammaproteobacteria bacterium]
GMLKGRPLPRAGGMAVIAAVATGNVVGRLACRCYAVVTAEAGTTNGIVIHACNWFPELISVTFLA